MKLKILLHLKTVLLIYKLYYKKNIFSQLNYMDYKQKYLKYKAKYLDLKAGSSDSEKIKLNLKVSGYKVELTLYYNTGSICQKKSYWQTAGSRREEQNILIKDMKYDVKIRSMWQSSDVFKQTGNFQFIGFRDYDRNLEEVKFEKSHMRKFLENFFDSLHHDSLGKWKSVLGKAHESDTYIDEMTTDLRLKLMDHVRINGKTIFEDLFDRDYDDNCDDKYQTYYTVNDIDPTKKK